MSTLYSLGVARCHAHNWCLWFVVYPVARVTVSRAVARIRASTVLHNPASLQGPSEDFKVDIYSMFEMARNLTWYGDKRVRETCE